MLYVANLIGIILIGLIIWWFWLSKPKARIAATGDKILIRVQNGVYSPAYIQVKVNTPVALQFLRKDASACAEHVIFDQLNINARLPLNKPVDLIITPKAPGEIEFTCQMGMYRGKLIVI